MPTSSGSRALLVSLLTLTISCSPSAQRAVGGSTAASIPDRATPIALLLGEGLGASTTEINAVVEMQRYELRKACLAHRGFSIREEAPLPDWSLLDGRAYARNAAKRVELGLVSAPQHPQGSGGADQLAYVSADDECSQQADAQVPNPLEAMNQWLNRQLEDVYRKVTADSRVVAAEREVGTCLSAVGSDLDALRRAELALIQSTEAVLNAFSSGELRREQAIAELLDLAVEGDLELREEYACLDIRAAMVFVVQSEMEREFLEQYGDALEEYIASARDDVLALMDGA